MHFQNHSNHISTDTGMFNSIKIMLLGIAFLLGGCTPIPIYQQPPSGLARAFVKPVVTTEKIVAGAATVSATTGPATCGKEFPGLRKVLTVSHRNPLVSDLNSEGFWIPAGERFYFVAMVHVDGAFCGQAASFVPAANGSYAMKLHGQSSYSRYEPATCSVEITKIDSTRQMAEEKVDPSFTLEACVPPKAD